MLIRETGLYTDESPGLKVDPVVVMTLSVVFIFSVVALHGMSCARAITAASNKQQSLQRSCAESPRNLKNPTAFPLPIFFIAGGTRTKLTPALRHGHRLLESTSLRYLDYFAQRGTSRCASKQDASIWCTIGLQLKCIIVFYDFTMMQFFIGADMTGHPEHE